jgi:hypothetical protein
MAKINNQPPKAPMWPWGAPGSVRERLVNPSQVNRKKAKKTGNPKNPALASAALLDFIGPAHSSEELRLATPLNPRQNDAPLEGFSDRAHLETVAERGANDQRQMLERGLTRINAPPERMDRLKALLQRESQMLTLMGHLHSEVEEIRRRMQEEQKDEGY